MSQTPPAPDDPFSLAGTRVLVTGASRGIGRACATACAAAGADLVLVARTEPDLLAVADDIGRFGVATRVETVDVTDEAAVEKLIRVNRPTIAVHAAGMNRPGPTVGYSIADWDAIMSVNLRSAFLVARAVGTQWLTDHVAGKLVFVSSQMGHVGYPGRAAYCASKHGLEGLTKALAVEWAPHGVTVNAVAPTFAQTSLTESTLSDPDTRADIMRRLPTGELCTPEEVANAVRYLVSPAARSVTGHSLLVDGGWTAW